MPAHSVFHAVGTVADYLNGAAGQIDAVYEHGKQKHQYESGYADVTLKQQGEVHSVAAAGDYERCLHDR